ncbi:hypothetical protein BGX28_006419 [Mortierella sp. GBA30]|nr:hypothetical protein BGX28_006419 [Mortierella sp. GBA30]
MSARPIKHGRYASSNYPSTVYESESSNSLLGPPLPLSFGDISSSLHSKASSAATTLSSHCSIESLRQHLQDQDKHQYSELQQDREQYQLPWSSAVVSTTELLNKNIALAQKTALAQQEVISVRNNQARLENQVYELDQKLAEVRKENHRLSRAKKDFDRQLEQSKTAFEKERSLWSERETELVRSVKFATRPLVVQAPAKDQYNLDNGPVDALPPLIQQQIAENNAAHARALRAHEKLVKELRDQLLSMSQELNERQRSFLLQQSELQAEIAQARELNKNLMEENESYQMLLHEKSMNGEFMQTDIMKNTGYDDDLTGTPLAGRSTGTINLADELGKAFERSPAPTADRTIESLTEELKTLKESNTALGVYISKILSRIMENPHLQAILAADYSPSRAFVPASPASVITQVNRTNGGGSASGNNSGSEVDTKREVKKPEVGRARSRSLFSGGSVFSLRSKPSQPPAAPSSKSSNRSSSEDDAASSGNSTGFTSFQEGHVLEDSPRTSQSSSEFAVVSNDHYHPGAAEYEQLTTFDQPFTRKQLQRHASLGAAAAHERHQRRQTIGSSGAMHGAGGGHGRYGSESSALQSSSRRSMMVKTKNSLSVLAPMPESSNLITSLAEVPAIPEGPVQEPEPDLESSMQSPVLSISTSVLSATSSNSSSSSAPVATPTTPVVTEGGVWRKMRRMSLFGGSNASNSIQPVPIVVKTEGEAQAAPQDAVVETA